MSMPMTPEEQPMPDRLWESTSVRILKWFTTMDASEGVGAKQEQITIRMSICTGAWQAHGQHTSQIRLLGTPQRAPKEIIFTLVSLHAQTGLTSFAYSIRRLCLSLCKPSKLGPAGMWQGVQPSGMLLCCRASGCTA